MKIFEVPKGFSTSPNSGDLYTIAVNRLEVNAKNEMSIYVTHEAVTQTQFATAIGGDDIAIKSITPEYFPYANAGAECSAVVTDLSWADNNLEAYEWLAMVDGATTKYLVMGVLNSSKTDFNDPFGAVEVDHATCWKGVHSSNFLV